MKTDDPSIRLEAIWAVANCTAGCNSQQMQRMVERQLIQALGEALSFQQQRSVFVALEGLTNVLKAG